MTKGIFLFGILVFGLTVVGCDNGSTSNGGGSFTLTNIPPEHNGKYAIIQADGYNLGGAESVNIEASTYTGSHVSNEKVSIPMWQKNGSAIHKYSGNDTVGILVGFFNSENVSMFESPPIKIAFYSVVFSNGSATKSWSDGTIE